MLWAVQGTLCKSLCSSIERITKTPTSSYASWSVTATTNSKRCRNHIRQIVDGLAVKPNPKLKLIPLTLGDPTVFGNLKAPPTAAEGVIKALKEGKYNGYTMCQGYESSRQAVADYLSYDGMKVKSKDIIICSGCSSCIELCTAALVDQVKGQNVIIPKPGFPLYQTLAEYVGNEVRYYNLVPKKNWEIDFKHLQSQIDSKTAAIVVNNPSNPCGSVFSKKHVEELVKFSEKNKIPLIIDEIYERITFGNVKFHSAASIPHSAPVLILGGMAKRFLVPGWRIGWIHINDPAGRFDKEVRKALISLSQRTMGSNTLIQGAMPHILKNTTKEFHDSTRNLLARNAQAAFKCLKDVKGLTPYVAEAAMYMMVQIHLEHFPQFKTGSEFIMRLLQEQAVFCLPGEAFFFPKYFRIVITTPEDKLVEACHRMKKFCDAHYKK